jgi:8-oxo-dGTP pyrophosphatase MutT (NUDIX family)
MQNHITEIIESLKKELQKPLPGSKAQHEMVPSSRLNDLAQEPVNPKKGGVLLLIYKEAEKLKLVFIQRTNDGGVHSGQISFPGGKFENGDKDLINTALREAEEEIGIDASKVQILGNLTTMFIPVSNYMVSPTVGFYNGTPEFEPNPDEVAGLLEVTLSHLVDDKTKGPGLVDVRGKKFEVPVFHVDHHKIWGATAMILNEFVQVVKRANGAVKL